MDISTDINLKCFKGVLSFDSFVRILPLNKNYIMLGLQCGNCSFLLLKIFWIRLLISSANFVWLKKDEIHRVYFEFPLDMKSNTARS